MNDLAAILGNLDHAVTAILGTRLPERPVLGNILSDPSARRMFAAGDGLTAYLNELLAPPVMDASGWILWSERLEVIQEGRQAPPSPGWPLAAELHFSERNESVHIQQQANDWIATTLSRSETSDNPNIGLPASFIEIRDFLAWPQLSLSDLSLRYEIAWQLVGTDTTLSYRPSVFRFAGFTRQR